MTTNNLLALVDRSVRRQRTIMIAVGLSTLALGAGMMAAAKWAPDDTFGPDHVHRFRVASVIIGAIFAAVAVLVTWQGFRLWHPARAPIMRLIAERAADLRWIYIEELASKAYGVTVKRTRSIKIGDAAGKLHTLMARNQDVDAVVAMLRELAPQARVGYDAGARAAFKQVKALRRRAA